MDQRLDDDPVALAADQVGDQPAVDLDRVERQRRQIGKARIAGSEIVDRDAEARVAKKVEPLGDGLVVDQQRAFGDFRGDPLGIDPGDLDLVEQPAS